MISRLKIERSAGATLVTLSDPDNLNRMDDGIVAELHEALDGADPKHTLAFRGAGTGFSAGRPHSSGGHPDGPAAAKKALVDLVRLNVRIAEWTAPTIGLVHGFANGAALGILQHMDIVVAESDAKFSFPEITYNLPPALVVSYLGRKLGDKAVRFLVMTGEEVSAERALAMGLISKVVDKGTLAAAQAKLLEHFAGRLEAETVLKAAVKQFQNNTGDLTAAMESGVEIVAAWARRPKPVA